MGILDNSFSDLSDKDVSLLNEYFHGFDYKGAGYTYLSNYIWKDMYNLTWEIIDGYLFLSGGSRIFTSGKCGNGEGEYTENERISGIESFRICGTESDGICHAENGRASGPENIEVSGAEKSGAVDIRNLMADGSERETEEDDFAVVAMPLTKDGTYDSERLGNAILKAVNKFKQNNLPFKMVMVPQHMKSILDDLNIFSFDFEERPNDDEYVYLKDKLITLSGRALHKKKNHLNYFLRTYNYDVRPLTADMKDEILNLVNGFMRIKDKVYEEDEMDQLKDEAEAIVNCISFLGDDDVYGVGLFIDDKMEGFAIGERLNKNIVVEHFEKANGEFRGIYQALCMEFCKSLPMEIEYVNREEDMGLENLRQAKQALRPDHMERYYNATIKASQY